MVVGVRWTEEENQLLQQHYSMTTAEELKKMFPNRTYDAIKLRAAKLGFKKELVEQRMSQCSVLLNDTPETYYWIGFILADGHIHNNKRLKVRLSRKDDSHIRKLHKFLNIESPISYCSNKDGYEYCGIDCQDPSIIPSVCEKFDIQQNKTLNPPKTAFDTNDENLFLSMFCGFLDGDGHIGYQSGRKDCSIRIRIHSAWQPLISKCIERINLIFNTDCPLGKISNDGYYVVNISNSIIVTELKKFVINNNLPYLSRKWDKIDETHVSRYITAKANRIKMKTMLSKGYTKTQIARELKMSFANVFHQIEKYNLDK